MGYQKEYEVHYYEIDRHKQATVVSILNYLEDTAISHSEAVGLGVDNLLALGKGWVLNRWQVIVDRYPRLGEKICVETWASNFERFYATREFVVTNRKGERLGRAGSLWIFLNLDKRRPVRIPPEVAEAYGPLEPAVIPDPFPDFLPAMGEQDITPVVSQPVRFHVRRSDIDTNGHVNNTRFVEWMLEGIEHDLTLDYQLKELHVLYKKEVRYGAEIASLCQAHPRENGDLEYWHRILNAADGQEHALGRSLWVRR